MKLYSPSVTPQTIVALAPIEAPRRTSVGRYSDLRETWLRGLITLVNTQLGPQNTSSSSVDALVDRDVVLHLHVVAQPGAAHDHDVLAQVAPLADDRARHHVAEMPDLRASADDGAVVDIAGFVGEVVGHGSSRCGTPLFTTEARGHGSTTRVHVLCLRAVRASGPIPNPLHPSCALAGFRYSPRRSASPPAPAAPEPRLHLACARSMSARTSAAVASPVLTK